ncbi:hypothetical protein REPUB_Repub09cG0065600 [Reevesia pubescens]
MWSAYHIAQSMLGYVGEVDNDNKPMWKMLWMMPKVRVFMWQLVKNISLTSLNFYTKGLGVSLEYSVCGFHDDNWEHTFFHCHYSLVVWTEVCAWMDDFIQRNGIGDNV